MAIRRVLTAALLLALVAIGGLGGCSTGTGGDGFEPPAKAAAPTRAGGSAAVADQPDDGTVSLVVATPGSLGYVARVPRDYDRDPSHRFAVLVYLHGLGEVGDGSMGGLRRLLSAGLPQIAATHGLPRSARELVILAPQTPVATWDPVAVHSWLAATLPRYRVDDQRLYLTGISMGGGGVVAYLDAYGSTGQVAAAVVISQDWTPVTAASSPLALPRCHGLADTPIWAFVGDLDTTVPHQLSTNLIGYLNRHCTVREPDRVTVLLSTFHNAWDKVYDLSALDAGSTDPAYAPFDQDPYSWLLAHHR